MSTADQNMSSVTNSFVEPREARDHFAQNYDLANPEAARDSYQRIMHEHTKQQFQQATQSSRRRSSGTSVPSLRAGDSMGSVSSTSS